MDDNTCPKKHYVDDKDRITRNIVIDQKTGCWEWQRCKATNGYGQVWMGGRIEQAHRLAWSLFVGPITEGLNVLHRCDNRACCNPDHLFLGTQQDNLNDMKKKGRQHRPVGESNGKARLTECDVVWIHRQIALGVKQADISEALGVTNQAVSKINVGKSWAYLHPSNLMEGGQR